MSVYMRVYIYIYVFMIVIYIYIYIRIYGWAPFEVPPFEPA